MLRIYNTPHRQVDDFKPITPGKVSLYTCGPTVYNYLHVGNWAAYIYWDLLVRVLQSDNYQVERVMNITDVGHLVTDGDEGEDKLQKGARREGKTAWQVAEYFSQDFISGMSKLNLLPPDHLTRATDYIEQQLDLVRRLKNAGFTYQISDGIYFDTAKFPNYASFAQLDLKSQQAGARVTFNNEKRSSSDFTLWKFSPNDEQRDMEWDTPVDLTDDNTSPKGFPGWHLECSAMAMSILGETIDIHTGGIDHIPVHHSNEIAQSQAATGKTFANYWLHNNHMKSDGTKISKSLGNGYTLNDLADKGFTPIDFKLFVLQSHYQSESNFSFDSLLAARNRLQNWRNIAALRHQTHDRLRNDTAKNDNDSDLSLLASSGALKQALNNNLDTPTALSIIDEAFGKLDTIPLEKVHQFSLMQLLETIDELLGLNLIDSTPDIDDDAKRIIIQRQVARDNKDWAESDNLRKKLLTDNILVKDTPHGPVWQYAD